MWHRFTFKLNSCLLTVLNSGFHERPISDKRTGVLNWYACNVRVLFCSCKICRGTANRHSPLWSVARLAVPKLQRAPPADWRHSVRSARPAARLSTWTNRTLIACLYRTKANTPCCCCCKWLVMFATNALSVLTSSIELFNCYSLWSSSYSLPRRLHSILLVDYLFFSLFLVRSLHYSSFSHLPPSFYSPFSLFSFSALFALLPPILLDVLSFIITFGSLILCLFILSHFSFCYSFSLLLFSHLLSCEYLCPWHSATFILLRIFFFSFFPDLLFLLLSLFCHYLRPNPMPAIISLNHSNVRIHASGLLEDEPVCHSTPVCTPAAQTAPIRLVTCL